jgi:hypothetical protein
LVALIAILIAPAVYADDPPGPPAPPQARIGIPPGIAGQVAPPTVFGLFWVWLQARIGVPIG